MDSSLVFSPFVLLFSHALMIDEKKGEIRFDNWYAYINKGDWQKRLLNLRKDLMPAFQDAMMNRDLSSFPVELAERVADFCKQAPITLRGCEPCKRSIDEEVTGPARNHLSIFEWPEDLGVDDEEDDDEQ